MIFPETLLTEAGYGEMRFPFSTRYAPEPANG
jgi:hypothetical protein